MLNISLQDAKDNLPELINLVEQGEDVFIIGDKETKIKLVSFTKKSKKRVFGQHRNLAVMSEDFNNPLPDNFWLGKYDAYQR
jgi:antitoxin (DNA-binding transcriptional repressor) of toxin-antitoxin stability system